MSDFKITDKSGIKLKTANTYVTEDLGVSLTDNDINNIVAENIKKDVSILGVVGTYEGNPATYWDGTYIEQNVFNVAINVETYENSVSSAGVFYSIDNGATFVKMETQTTININKIPYIMFKYVGYSGGGVPGIGSYCHIGTTSGGRDIINANDAEYRLTITTENIELTKDTTFYVNMVYN